MARIALVDPADPANSSAQRALLAEIEENMGRLFNVHRAMANHPEALQAYNALADATYRRGSLTRVQAELAYTTATIANDCFY